MRKIKVHVTYTIESDYEFDRDELKHWANPDNDVIELVHNQIEEDFNRVEVRVNNVLPRYHSSLTFTTKEINE